jgi:drug/metabolite transporter (DMT)-like permease
MPSLSTPMRAALLMLGSTAFFGLMVVAIRLASTTLHVFEAAFFRNVFGLAATLPLLFLHGPRLLRTSQFPRYLFRCVIGVCAMLASFWAIANLPLAHAIALSYSTPLFVIIAAAALLGEQVHIRRWTAVALGIIGVLIIVRPGTGGFSPGSVVALLAAVLGAVIAVQIKQLSETEPADRIVIYTTLLWIPLSFLPALSVWQWPQGITWLWLVMAGVMGTGGQVLWTRALKLGEVSALTPISFVQLPIVALFGWLLFDEELDRWTVNGALIILAANTYIAHREAVLARRAASMAATAAAKPGE